MLGNDNFTSRPACIGHGDGLIFVEKRDLADLLRGGIFATTPDTAKLTVALHIHAQCSRSAFTGKVRHAGEFCTDLMDMFYRLGGRDRLTARCMEPCFRQRTVALA